MDIFSVVGLVISGVATAASVLAWRVAQKSAEAAERQAVEASRAVQISQIVALNDARLKALENIPKVAVRLEDSYQSPCILTPYESAYKKEDATRPAPQKLDPTKEHRIDFLGKLFRGVLVNYDTRPVAVMADRGLFIEGATSLLEERGNLTYAQSPGTYLLEPGQAALFEWFGSCTVIDWYELARMPAAEAFQSEMGVCIPYTIITVNYVDDEQWTLPAIRVILRISRLLVYLPFPDPDLKGPTDPIY